MLLAPGQPGALWPGVPWPVPSALAELAATPRAHVVAALPLLETRDGAIGFVPFHRQRVVAPPGVHEDVAARERFLEGVNRDDALRALASLPREQLAGRSSPQVVAGGLSARGIDRVVLVGGDPALRASVSRLLGPPRGDMWAVGEAP
jgi:hypothetical protein